MKFCFLKDSKFKESIGREVDVAGEAGFMGNFINDVKGNQGADFLETERAVMGAKTCRMTMYELLF